MQQSYHISLFYLIFLAVLPSCKQPLANTRHKPLPTTDEATMNRIDGGVLAFNLKLPDNHAELTGSVHELANLAISANSDHIAFECRPFEGLSATPVSKIRFVLTDTSTNETHLAQFDYSCPNGADIKLKSLKTQTDYLLTVLVSNDQGVTYVGTSEIFRTSEEKITVKMKRVEAPSDVEVEVSFPSVSQPKPTLVTCIFEQLSQTATSKTGGTCIVEIRKSRLMVPPSDSAETVKKECQTAKGACVIELGVLKSQPGKIEVALDSLKVTGKRNGCPADAETKLHYLIISEKAHDRILTIPECGQEQPAAIVTKDCHISFQNNGKKSCEVKWPEGYRSSEAFAQPTSPGSICQWKHDAEQKRSECHGIRFAKFTPSDAICDCKILFSKN